MSAPLNLWPDESETMKRKKNTEPPETSHQVAAAGRRPMDAVRLDDIRGNIRIYDNRVAERDVAELIGEIERLRGLNVNESESEYAKALRTGIKPDIWPPVVMSREELEHFRRSVGVSN